MQPGYALSRYGGTRNNKLTGGVHRSWYCLGVMSCSESNCQFVLKPALPNRLEKRLGAPPSQASLEKYCCPKHAEAMLQWIPCNSDGKGNPCQATQQGTPKLVTTKARADIPFGFSYRKHPQTRGKLPICRGCQQPIENTVELLRVGTVSRRLGLSAPRLLDSL